MRFLETTISGAWLVEPEAREDERGFFARVWDQDELAARQLPSTFVQCNNSLSRFKGTLRGLHYQVAPNADAKLIRCVRGRMFDVMVDMRPESPTYRRWYGKELTSHNRALVFIPSGCAHGYLSLDDDCEVIYWATARYSAADERGVRWNDPGIGIEWPIEPSTLSDKDRRWPDLPR